MNIFETILIILRTIYKCQIWIFCFLFKQQKNSERSLNGHNTFDLKKEQNN